MSEVNWRGDDVLRRVQRATEFGIDRTMADAVVESKRNHPGWKNKTGTAEGSIRIVKEAGENALGGTSGEWGSTGVNYMIFLEVKHGSALRSATRVYRNLKRYIREEFQRRA